MEPWTILGSLLLGYVATAGARATDPFRKKHAELRAHLNQLVARVGSLGSVPPNAQKSLMREIVDMLESKIRPHVLWAERVLYPLVDKKSGGGGGITSSMRYEHRILDRWIDELSQEAARSKPDPRAFGRRALNLIGLLQANFEEVEEVLLPVLDRTMTAQEIVEAMTNSG